MGLKDMTKLWFILKGTLIALLYSNPSNSCFGISLWTKNIKLNVALEGKSGDQNSLGINALIPAQILLQSIQQLQGY